MRKALFIFGLFSDADVDWLAAAGRAESHPPGSVLIREGQSPDSLFFVLDGNLAVTTAASRDRVLALLGPGEIVGEMSYVDARPANATVSASEPARVLRIPREVVTAKLANDRDFATHFYRAVAVFLAHRLRSTVTSLEYGEGTGPRAAAQAADEPDAALRDTLVHGAARLDSLLKRLKS